MNVYMLDYLNMVLLSAGVFETREAAEEYAKIHDPDGLNRYKVVTLTMNIDGDSVVPYDAPVSRYACQR